MMRDNREHETGFQAFPIRRRRDKIAIVAGNAENIRDFESLVMQTTTARELCDQMLKVYPDWVNPGALWTSVRTLKS